MLATWHTIRYVGRAHAQFLKCPSPAAHHANLLSIERSTQQLTRSPCSRRHTLLRTWSFMRLDALPPGRGRDSRSKPDPYSHPSSSVVGSRTTNQPPCPSISGGRSSCTGCPLASLHAGQSKPGMRGGPLRATFMCVHNQMLNLHLSL